MKRFPSGLIGLVVIGGLLASSGAEARSRGAGVLTGVLAGVALGALAGGALAAPRRPVPAFVYDEPPPRYVYDEPPAWRYAPPHTTVVIHEHDWEPDRSWEPDPEDW